MSVVAAANKHNGSNNRLSSVTEIIPGIYWVAMIQRAGISSAPQESEVASASIVADPIHGRGSPGLGRRRRQTNWDPTFSVTLECTRS
jgi:hypothetical protein